MKRITVAMAVLSLVFCLSAYGKTRFTVSKEGVIIDSQSNLEWMVGPDHDTTYDQAVAWVTSLTETGGGWRMPTTAELQTLYQQGVGERNMDPAFKTTGWAVWGEPHDSWSSWDFNFTSGVRSWNGRDISDNGRVFAVRPLPRSGSPVSDLATGKTRFTVSKEGVIIDSQTPLEWMVGPDHDTTYDQAVAWVSGLAVAGGGWRMPTVNELQTLYQQGVGERNMDPSFKNTGWRIWGEPQDSSSAWHFNFGLRNRFCRTRDYAYYSRVFAVRPLPR